MSLLLSLPTVVAHVVLSEWLSIYSWVSIDTAISTKKYRKALCELLSSLNAPDISEENRRVQMYSWIYAKAIKLIYLDLRPEDFVNERLTFPVDCDFVEHIVVHKGTESCSEILNNCKNMLSLQFFDPLVILDLNIGLCSSLTSLTVVKWNRDCLKHIKTHCNQLRRFTILETKGYEEVFDVIKANPLLEHIEVGCNAELWSFLMDANNLKCIRSVTLFYSTLTLTDVNTLLSLRTLDYFNINNRMSHDALSGYLYLSEVEHSSELLLLVSSFTNLKRIVFNNMNDQTDEMLHIIRKSSSHTLLELGLCSCMYISIGALVQLFEQCPLLRSFCMFHPELDDDLILKLFNAEVPNRLEDLVLQAGLTMTITTMSTIIHNCPVLKFCYMINVLPIANAEDQATLDRLKSWRGPHSEAPLELDVEWSRIFEDSWSEPDLIGSVEDEEYANSLYEITEGGDLSDPDEESEPI